MNENYAYWKIKFRFAQVRFETDAHGWLKRQSKELERLREFVRTSKTNPRVNVVCCSFVLSCNHL